MCECIDGAVIQKFPCNNAAGEEFTLSCKNPILFSFLRCHILTESVFKKSQIKLSILSKSQYGITNKLLGKS